jgi:radical SAM-linked protein
VGDEPTSAGGLPERLRFRFAKLGKIRFTSQRDVARMWERALRRSGLPVAFSGGFSPRPLLSFGLALPTGAESLAEYLDVRLESGRPPSEADGDSVPPTDLGELAELLTDLLPDGLAVLGATAVPISTGSLQQEVTSCSWELDVLGLAKEALVTRVEQFLAAPSTRIRRTRKGREVEDDIRPAVRVLVPTGEVGSDRSPAGPVCGLYAELATQPRGIRPAELVEGLGSGVALGRARRTQQWIERDGTRWEPLPWSGEEPGGDAPHAKQRAS